MKGTAADMRNPKTRRAALYNWAREVGIPRDRARELAAQASEQAGRDIDRMAGPGAPAHSASGAPARSGSSSLPFSRFIKTD